MTEVQLNEFQILYNLKYLKDQMESSKSDQRLPSDRNKAVAVTQLELVIAYWNTYVTEPINSSDTSEQ